MYVHNCARTYVCAVHTADMYIDPIRSPWQSKIFNVKVDDMCNYFAFGVETLPKTFRLISRGLSEQESVKIPARSDRRLAAGGPRGQGLE
jgi:hypothetical protein